MHYSIPPQLPAPVNLRRYQVFRSRDAREFLCIAAARDSRHALHIARQLFQLTRTAWARPEPVSS